MWEVVTRTPQRFLFPVRSHRKNSACSLVSRGFGCGGVKVHDWLLCLDIETVPDRELIPGDWGDKFPKAMWHRVVAVSVVEARIERDGAGRERYLVDCCRTGGEADWDERRILQAYWRYFGDRRARVVTWNGKSFDLPVLRLRACLSAPVRLLLI